MPHPFKLLAGPQLRKHGPHVGNRAANPLQLGLLEALLRERRADLMVRDDGAVVALGALIRGGTPHFEYLAAEVTKGLAQVALETGVPVSYGVITADTLEQAIERAGTKAGNKGFEAALSAIEMANLFAQL